MTLFWSSEQMERFEDLRQKELTRIFASDASVMQAEAKDIELSQTLMIACLDTSTLDIEVAVQWYHVCIEIM